MNVTVFTFDSNTEQIRSIDIEANGFYQALDNIHKIWLDRNESVIGFTSDPLKIHAINHGQAAPRVSVLENDYPVQGNDPWIHRSEKMKCSSCMYFAQKGALGRCRRNAPTMSGFPTVFPNEDWCGNHKLDETKL